MIRRLSSPKPIQRKGPVSMPVASQQVKRAYETEMKRSDR
jgi:hypothetical protein